MILKILLVAGVIAIIYFMFIKKKPAVQNSNKEKKRDEIDSSDMVECSTCGIYCEIDDAILSNGKYYCSKECIEKAK
ncbi:hypothetical protein CVO_07835 [Sulfurimonas sp. CVO]|jgi:uncharacterized protein|uniref:Prokaryotic metallothionein n=1 Tax=Sulfurimonas xiamenensis TaxID=2590021 RepID=A0AAJ4A2G5_9BACT|nr:MULTISPECIES: PP0621 family protein [Sulfurimonas]PLY12250.1 MAG: hypothetical protein C0628_08565 [Sulfurimonas sp.]QFR42671.1 hypothetical protein FJR47_01565 [Sulfurimonas xiamenensis]QHG91738.1 hypothetical protein CVO_07835 [Sulfurimonas sp. CVO]